MAVVDEVNFAWALAGVARDVLSRRERTWTCVTLGAGDSPRTVVEHLLTVIAAHGIVLSDDLLDSALDWLVGFTGAEEEMRLKSLVEGVCAASHNRVRSHGGD